MLTDRQIRLLRKWLPNGALFDLIMLCLFAGLLPFVQPLINSQKVFLANGKPYLSWKAGVVFLIAVAAQMPGFWFKRQRAAQGYNHHIKQSADPSYPIIGGISLVLMHLIIFGVWLVNDGVNYINNSGTWWLTIIKIIGILTPTIVGLVVSSYATHHPEIEHLGTVSTGWDLMGTILLSVSSFVAVASLWALLLGEINLNMRDGRIWLNGLLSFLYFLAFLVLYLPTRWAFLLTDYRQPYTWLRMAIVFLPFLKGLWMGYAYLKIFNF